MSLVNPNPKDTWKPGDKCSYEENWSGLAVRAVIKEIKTHEAGFLYAVVDGIEGHYGTTSRPLDQLFETERDCLAAQQAASVSSIKKYESEIKTVEDLVRFAYDHCISCAEEYTDWDARKAYCNRANALLGVDLDGIAE